MKRGEQKLNIAGVKFGIIIIMTAMCLAGCSKEKAFVDSCDSEIAEQVTSIMQESQKGRYNLENCEVLVMEESKEAGFLIRRMTFQADWKRIREPEDDPLIQGMLQARDELKSPGEKEAAGRIIDGYIVEMNSEPETERSKQNSLHKFLRETKHWNCFIPLYRRERKRCFHSRNMRKRTGLKMPKSGCRRDAGA